jgi:hypothetical protein
LLLARRWVRFRVSLQNFRSFIEKAVEAILSHVTQSARGGEETEVGGGDGKLKNRIRG